MFDVLLSPLMVRALIAAAVTGLAAPTVGTYLVQRRLALLGDGIGHICVTGVALGLLTGTSPTFTAIVIAIIGALVIELIRSSGKASGDVALALLFYGGIAGGLVLISAAGNGAFALQGYLFGSITAISWSDVTVSVLLAVANDEDFARTTGVSVRFYNVLISVLAAVSVSVAMRTVGLLLVSALMIIPVATAQQFTRSFRVTVFAAMAAGSLAALVGVTTTAYVDAPPGPMIVLVALAGFTLTAPVGMLVQRRRRALVPFVPAVVPEEDVENPVEEPHGHEHGERCGHLAVEHGDHVDYIHDGHRHAVHGGHYDEH
jgi:zinc transport system permease protein